MVTLYTQPGCAPCKVAERELTKAGIAYHTVNVRDDEEAAERIRAAGFTGTPVLEFRGAYANMIGLRDIIAEARS